MNKSVQVADIVALVLLATALSAWIWALSDRVTGVEKDVKAHQDTTDIKLDSVNNQLEGLRQHDRDIVNRIDAQYAEIIRQMSNQMRRLERIEDSIQRHMENSNNHQDDGR